MSVWCVQYAYKAGQYIRLQALANPLNTKEFVQVVPENMRLTDIQIWYTALYIKKYALVKGLHKIEETIIL